MHKYDVEYTDTLAGEANYARVKRAVISVPDMTHYGYDGYSNYTKARKPYERALVTKAKAALGLTGVPCAREAWGDTIILRPRNTGTFVFITWKDE